MKASPLELAARIRGEVVELDRVVERTQRVWARAVRWLSQVVRCYPPETRER